MPLSQIVTTATAAQTDFTYNKGYISQSHVIVKVDGVVKTLGDYTFVNNETIRFTVAMTGGELVFLSRATSQAERIAKFKNATTFSDKNLETDSRQAFLLAQEAIDEFFNALQIDAADLQYDALSKRIKSLATPINASDAVTKVYVDAIAAAAGNMPVGDPLNNMLLSNGSVYLGALPSAVRAALSLVVGTDVQAFDALLADIAALTADKGQMIVSDATDLVALPVGADKHVMTANSALTLGVGYAEVPLPSGWNTISTVWANAQDIIFSAGAARNSSDTNNIVNAAALTKQIDANWVAGDNAGGFPSGLTLADATTYHLFVIRNSTSGVVDAGYDTSLTATNLLSDATGYNEFIRIGSVVTDSSTTIADYLQVGPWFYLATPVRDVSSTNPGNAPQTITLTIPTGVALIAMMTIALEDINPASGDPLPAILVTPLENTQLDTSLSIQHAKVWSDITKTEDAGAETFLLVATNTSAQVRVEMANSNAGVTEFGVTFGWYDKAGRNA